MTLRLTDQEAADLRRKADEDGASMQETARKAVRLYTQSSVESQRDLVRKLTQQVMTEDAAILDRLGNA